MNKAHRTEEEADPAHPAGTLVTALGLDRREAVQSFTFNTPEAS